MREIIISNNKKLEEIKKKIFKEGKEKFQVITDFDNTLTKAFINGKSTPSIISILRNENYLTPDYPSKAHALFNKYHPIEISIEINDKEKKKAMKKWWE